MPLYQAPASEMKGRNQVCKFMDILAGHVLSFGQILGADGIAAVEIVVIKLGAVAITLFDFDNAGFESPGEISYQSRFVFG
jgi:hypothetical protein